MIEMTMGKHDGTRARVRAEPCFRSLLDGVRVSGRTRINEYPILGIAHQVSVRDTHRDDGHAASDLFHVLRVTLA